MGLSAGLSTTVPDPVGDDGTGFGPITEDDTNTAESAMENGLSKLHMYWTGPWPLLHYVSENQIVPDDLPSDHPAKHVEGKTLNMHVAKNLLRQTEINEISATGDSHNIFAGEIGEILILNIAFEFLLTPARLAASQVENAAWSGNLPVFVAGIVTMTALLVIAYKFTWDFTFERIESGEWSYVEAAAIWVWLAMSVILSLLGVSISELFLVLVGFMPLGFTAKAMSDCIEPYAKYEMMIHSLFAFVILSAFALTLLCGAAAFFCQSLVE